MIKLIKVKKYNLIFGVIIGFVLAQMVLAEGYAILAAKQQSGEIFDVNLLAGVNNPLKMLALVVFIITIIILNTKIFGKINLNKIGLYLILVVLVSIIVAIQVTFMFCRIIFLLYPNFEYKISNNYFFSINIFYIVAFIGIATFLITFTLLVNIKVNYIKYLTKEVKIIKNEGFGKVIKVKGGDELAELCGSINDMSLELGEKIANEKNIENNKNELITNISHDLKTPLTSIIGYLELLNSTEISERKKDEYIQIAYNKSLRLKELVNELFEYTKLASNELILKKDRINISVVLSQALGESIINFSDKNIDVVLDNPYDELFCNVDSAQILRVFENLIKNAEKYSDINSVFKVVVRLEKEQIVISFRNKCTEINEEDLENIFEKFYRKNKSRSNEGSGLGLPIAKRIIELYGGNILAEKINEDIKFNIYLESIE
ncbi:HAMP domain-containing sensor histidine kinase [Clostridium butyricum]|uniref:histidine kinase n=1 Tax=Clostridium butyricum E4 str. BoNT E BL5262 TaxID=632245 RepID=C4ICR2_CLOBU|nr:HAMP domain-containing sensor histidine kinase [Clostridium butyricum]EDT73522.1 Two component system histidine kinase [Clostridium butyricum 5521]EEP56523.1 histidine kinase [Clostridium butyricum E4 str. BoNT E BL5262]NFL32930.1 HAMP domain-containing histidine kinase [Clostridium butyricum]NFS19881.1 HAMP domain-containing histidine kinase [Clostridium butyricum]